MPRAEARRASGPQVLVGTSDRRVVAAIRRALSADHAVLEVPSAAQILALADAEPRPVAVIVDAASEADLALDVCRARRGWSALRRPPVLVVLGSGGGRRAAPLFFEAGADDVIERPIEAATLRVRVALNVELCELRRRAAATLGLDPATQVVDERTVAARIDLEWKRAAREATPLSLVVVRVDDHAAFVEECGPDAADDCLARIAAEVAAVVRRPMDTVGRSGADGLAVVLPATEHAGALHLAEMMREGVETLTLPHPRSRASRFVTLSAGVATVVPFPDTAADGLVAAARRGAERAALGGGNRVRSVDADGA